jgi:hypothetical protein
MYGLDGMDVSRNRDRSSGPVTTGCAGSHAVLPTARGALRMRLEQITAHHRRQRQRHVSATMADIVTAPTTVNANVGGVAAPHCSESRGHDFLTS